MAASDKTIRIFVSSPGDVQPERKVLDEVIKRINSTQDREHRVHLEVWKSEDAVPQIGPQAQAVIDPQTPSYDIYLGIMAHRFGSPTGKYESGTEQEFMDAFEQWGQIGKPWILFYFNEAAVNPATLDLDQYVKVCKFRERVKQQGLYAKYDSVRGSDTSFFEQVELHLRNVIPLIRAPLTTETKTKQSGVRQPTKPTIQQSYLDWLRRQCADVDLLGLRLKEGRAIRLNHVYVPLTAGSELLLNQLDRQSIYVSGNPGSGKSTFCRWVAWLACEESMPPNEPVAPEEYRESFPESFANRLPLLVQLRDFWPFLPHDERAELSLAGLEKSLSAWIDEKKRPGLDWPNVKQHLEQGTALVVFDGLDEVPLSRSEETGAWHPRSLLISGLTEAVAEWDRRQSYHDRNKGKKKEEQKEVPPPNRLLITSRPYGLRDADLRKLGLPHARIEELSQLLQELLVRRWFSILAEDTATGNELAADMLAHLSGQKGIEDLQASPMLLTAICIIYYEGKRLPHDRCDLYDRIVETVLYNRFGDPIELESVRNELCVVAHTMHTGFHLGEERKTPLAQITYDEIDRTLEAYRQKRRGIYSDFKDVVTARENLLSETGLLLPRGDDTAAFYHLSIQEFLAAERLWLEIDLASVFRARSEAANWRNTLSFLFGTQLNKRSEPDQSIALLETLIEACRPDQPGLLLAIGDGVGVLRGKGAKLPRNRLDEYSQSCVTAIEHDKDIQRRHEWCLELGRVGDPRIVVDLRDRAAYVEIPAGRYAYQNGHQEITEPFLLSRYPVTNSQYELFMKEDGYGRQESWSGEGWDWLQMQQNVREPRYWRDASRTVPNQPVVGVSFWEAEAFCTWAGGELPDEKHWEAAARGPEGRKYPWGNEWEDDICNSFAAKLRVTSSVGLFPRSRSQDLGLEDMAGNVWEWCQDEHETRKGGRVLRGGSFLNNALNVRSAFRLDNRPGYRTNLIGFRVART